MRKSVSPSFESFFVKEGRFAPHVIETDIGAVGIAICYEAMLTAIPCLFVAKYVPSLSWWSMHMSSTLDLVWSGGIIAGVILEVDECFRLVCGAFVVNLKLQERWPLLHACRPNRSESQGAR